MDVNKMLYFITPQGETTENKNSNIQGSSRIQSGAQGSRNKFDLSSTYEQYIRPLKENGVDKEPTYFPYISKLPGKVKIVGDKSLRKLVNKHHRRWKEKYPSEKFPLDSKIFESNMLNSIKPGPIPGFDSAEYGLVEDRRSISSSSTQISNNNIRSTMGNYAQASLSELGPHTSLLDEDKTHEKKKKKKRKHEMDYDGERKRKHKHDKEHKEHRKNEKKRKKEKEKEKEKEKDKYI
ncbi:unnamed protein product [Rhizophagus irregularis]|uniref:Mediator of RNA polymerase II transcription subunit 19 n=2 Tax=Rhizophagus irregularis TaxID=588596 RepID=A0A2N1MRV9_9GLOM|nr:hypothetical protein RirG_114960 [Rhizophagus irregularis DAOM 197198w]PKK64357.1 hypothetical protein RhiirC2_756827 [Rhizophagus irregularis]CAB5324144.1 unnamed protein product [Rhizophagus irregularis]